MTKFNVGDKIITRNSKFWSNKEGIVEKIIINEIINNQGAVKDENIFLVRLAETELLMGFKANELMLISREG